MPVPTAGHLPARASEIVLGAQTLAAVHARIGSTVAVSVPGMPRRLPRTVVGTAIFPSMGASIGLGSGAVLTAAGLRNLVPPGVPLPPFAAFLVRFRPGTSQAAGLAALASRLDPLGPFGVSGPGRCRPAW